MRHRRAESSIAAMVLWLAIVVAFLGGCGDDSEQPEDEASNQASEPSTPSPHPVNHQKENHHQDPENIGEEPGNQGDQEENNQSHEPDPDPEPEPEPLEPLEPGGFGDWCDEERSCQEAYTCIEAPFEGERGLCSRGCEPLGSSCLGIPAPGTNAECLYEPGIDETAGSCAFICVLDHGDHIHSYDCPPELICEEGGGAGLGNAYCVPPVD